MALGRDLDMPLLLRCDELEPGMRLSEAIIHGGRRLLTGGKTLTHADVDSLRSRYPELSVRVVDPILDNIVGFEDDSREREVAVTAQRKISRTMSDVSRRFSSRMSITAMDVNAIHNSVTEVMDYLRKNPVSSVLLSHAADASSYLVEHAGSVFYLSMILGCAVRDYIDAERRRRAQCRWLDYRISTDLLPLGLGAMVADLGMFPLQHLFAGDQPLSEDDRQAIREHPGASADMLPSDFPPIARAIVRTHHESFDGSGYPGGMKGDRIHIFTRIVRIADAYDAATATHVYREAKSAARAVWEMSVGPYSRFYDPVLMKVFTRLIQPFPIGAKLRLRDGRYAVVVRYNRQDPFKPTVVIAFDANGKRLPDSKLEGPLSLAEQHSLRIQSFGDEQLSYLYGCPSADELVLTRKDFATLFESVFP